MMSFSLRSLLLAAIVLSNCISWTASRHHYTHNVSGHRSRHRRQGAGLFLSASYVLPGGEGTGWGEWGEVSPCSRTCGGGVASQKRICLHLGPDGKPQCRGGDTKYFSCETQDCPAGSRDYREQQCSEYDNKEFSTTGVKYRWVPYTQGPNPCDLNCMPINERFYYRHGKVVDGTRCNDESFDVCVNGTCQPVGCDMMLGSNAREDKCRECRGSGANCQTTAGVIDRDDLRSGYNDILLIPEGATNIAIAERGPSRNYLALHAKNGTYYLNGEYHIDFPRSLPIAGALWYYERSQQGFAAPDKLRCLGPTNEPLIVALLLLDDNVGVEYEYSVPNERAPPKNKQYNWAHEEFSPCSAPCGGGYQTRNVTCRTREELDLVDDVLCDKDFKPVTNQTCNTEPCEAQWTPEPWGECSKRCGEGGTRSRAVHCTQIISNGYPSIVGEKSCFDIHGPKPPLHETCNENATCPIWFTGPWKPCDKLCDEGKQTRQVVCYQKNGSRKEILNDEECEGDKPPTEQSCMLQPCDGVDWVLSEWVGCDSCLSTVRTRTAVCTTKAAAVVNDSFCSYHETPVTEEPCDKTELPSCDVQWYATQWSKCSVDCGKGVQTRKVFCGIFDGASVMKVNDARCADQPKYNTTKECEVPEDKCPSKFFAGPWGVCDKECGGGQQYREVMCLRGGKPATDCTEKAMVSDSQECNTGPCDKDELLSVNKTLPPPDDDYEDCIEEDYPEVGLDSDFAGPAAVADLFTTMFSDSPTEGSGTSETWSTSSAEFESTFPETLSTEELLEGTGSTSETELEGSGDTTFSTNTDTSTDWTTDTGETDATTSSISEDTSATSNDTASTVSGTESSEYESSSTEDESSSSSASKETDETESTESEGSTLTTESGPTDVSGPSTVSSTEATELSTSTPVEGTSESTGTTEIEVTESTGTGETGTTESSEATQTGSTEPTETTETEVTESTETTETETTESTETTETETTESTETTETETTESSETTETGTTESTEITQTGSTESTETSTTESSEPTETEPTESTETTETATTESTETTETGTSESTETIETETTESTEFTETGSTESPETTETGTTESTETTETETTESNETTETETTESTETTEFTETTESTETTETGSTESTETTGTGSTETTETYTGSTESTITEESSSTETTEEGSTSSSEATESSSETATTETSSSSGTTPWDLSSTIEEFTTTKKARVCRPRSCKNTAFGCCPDKKTPALGPFDAGCPKPHTCAESFHGCCPDGVSPAQGPLYKGCPVEPCAETLFGCCESDNITAAEGNDQEGCPPPPPACFASKYGCCNDETEAKGPEKEGCPETSTTVTPPTEESTESTEGSESTASGSTETSSTTAEGCNESEFGCCFDNKTPATGPELQGCPCSASQFGCCPDGVSTAQGPDFEGCVKSCNTSAFGCCPDGESPAHGPDDEGCCLKTSFGCCPDNYRPAKGPHLEGCGCQESRFGCCPDNVTIATGPNNKGCGCQYTEHGCCPDRHTEASGPEFEGCLCHTYQFGCCPDGVTFAQGPNGQGCYCLYSKFGCCGDEQTHAKGPNSEGCDCSTSKHGCCLDGVTEATGPKFEGCTEKPLDRQAACHLKFERGPCRNYSVSWFYDTEYGGCSRFWYGGCEGNGNRFNSKEECEDTCVSPPPKEACRLPQVKGACSGYNQRWYYDTEREMCSNFIYGGCLGNANNFESRELCQAQCEPEVALEQCSLAIERGSCAGNYLRWGYNKEEKICEQFVWGGCEGNSNRFSSEAACMLRCNPPGEPQPECLEPQAEGNCTDIEARWSFSQTENRCVPFYYKGCGGNGNKYTTREECELACPSEYEPELCTLPASIGDCYDYREKWYFDTKSQRCAMFYYGGCGGNENRFNSEEECANRCIPPATTPAPRPPVPETDICQLPMLEGPCNESEMRWFYNAATDTCSQFTYGGCDGNENRFGSREECESRCKSAPVPAIDNRFKEDTTSSDCVISPVLEQCSPETVGEVWYYNEASGECTAHENSDSGVECRNTGVFYSQEACERSCGVFRNIDVCQYDKDPGPCRAYLSKYYYNRNTSRCEEFAYGGCFGGANRFSTEQECEQVCMTSVDPCTLPAEPGNCVDYFEKWYYQPDSDECYRFVFGGCGGNDNRFDSREACEGRCKKQPVAPATPAPTPTVKQPEPQECRTPESLAPCGTNETVFYFDEATSSCQAADIGGCGYFAKLYRSEEECERSCGAFQGIDVCRTELDPGPCRAAIPKFYFEAASGSCRDYTYGGCQGGPNRFSTIEECQEVCAGAGPEPSTACAIYTEECAVLDTTCEFGVKMTMTAEGCSRCECQEPVSCDVQLRECDALRCRFGIQRTALADGCPKCDCLEDPCSRNPCAPTERCVVVGSRDAVTQEAIYDAQCESNEIVDCNEFELECSRLRCQYGIQRTRVGSCERCSCVREETNCTLLRQECDGLKCLYGIVRTTDADGCERCMCQKPPCETKRCPTGERCISTPFRDPTTQETRYAANCKLVNKPGECPAPDEPISRLESACRRECADDAECRGVKKCCVHGCSRLCLPPAPPTTPLPSTTHTPDVPRAPEPYPDAEHNQPEVAAAEGGKATLRCYFHGNPPPKITWRFGEVTIEGDAGRYRLLSDGALEIISLFRNDSGVYICVAQNEHGTAEQQVMLTVADPVETPAAVATAEGRVTGDLGRELVVVCPAYGFPPPTIYWYRGREMVPYSNAMFEARGLELRIRRLALDTLGEYVCQAYNGRGRPATWRVAVHAYRPPHNNHRSAFLLDREVLVTPRAPPTPAPPTTTERPFITIPPYIVPVHTSLPQTSSGPAGSQISLPCEVDGYPDPEVRWTKDDAPVASGDRIWIAGSRLTIERAEVADSGVYSCHAANAYSAHSSAVRVTVTEVSIPPTCVDNPTFANCALIVQSRFCVHKYYSNFCCKSCVEAGQLNPRDALMQVDQSFFRK